MPATSKAELFARKRACMEAGQRRVASDEKGLADGDRLVLPKYCYSESRNTCLYSVDLLSSSGLASSTVDDLLTNEILAENGTDHGKLILGIPLEAFVKRHQELFATCVQ